MSATTSHVLLEHYLKTLKMPSILREHRKMAAVCQAEGADYATYLLRPIFCGHSIDQFPRPVRQNWLRLFAPKRENSGNLPGILLPGGGFCPLFMICRGARIGQPGTDKAV